MVYVEPTKSLWSLMAGFSTLDIVRIFNIPRERFREWMNRGFVRPSIKKAEGQGIGAVFSNDDLYRIYIFRDLIEQGLSRWVAASYVAAIKEKHFMTSKFFIIKESIDRGVGIPKKDSRDETVKITVDFAKNEEELSQNIRMACDFKVTLIINIAKIREEVDGLIE